MTRVEFMETLKALLAAIPENEREEALQYYNDYFDDAGLENEEQVIRELGAPEQVAQKILAEHSEESAEYSEWGYEDTRFRDSQEIISRSRGGKTYEKAYEDTRTAGQNDANKETVKKQKTANGWKVLAIVLLCILATPIMLPVGIAIVAVLVAAVLAIIGVCFGIVVAGVAVLVAGLVVVGVGLAKMLLTPAVGLAVTGVGFLLFALGIVLSLLILWCCVKVIPWFVRGIVGLLKRLFRKAGA